MYYQLAEIHAIAILQLAECAHWCWSNLMSSPVWVGTGRQRPTADPSVAMMAPPPPTDFSPQAPSW
jgi:hypothetical protein